jgi:hypothetical protein
MSLPPNDEFARECPACRARVPGYDFCSICGAESATPTGLWRAWLRPRTFAAAPRERVAWPVITSSLFPQLSERARNPFRHGLFLLLAMLTTFSMLQLVGPLVTVMSLGVALLFLLYLWQSDALTDISAPALAISAALGAGLSTAWWLWTGDVVANAYGIPLGAASQLETALGIGMAITAAGAVLMVLPPVAVRALRLPIRESLDGFSIGALGALAYSAAGTITWLGPQFTTGLLDNYGRWRLFEDAFLYGLCDPLTAAASGGMVGLALWFRPARRGGREPRRLSMVLWALAVICIAIYFGIYLVDNEDLPRLWEIAINAALTALSLIVLRAGVQTVLLHEAPEPATDRAVYCEHCGQTVQEMAFCRVCGPATRATSRAARHRRRHSDDGERQVAR